MNDVSVNKDGTFDVLSPSKTVFLAQEKKEVLL